MKCINGNLSLPLGWKEILLDAVVKRSSGHTPDKNIGKYWNGNIPWISLKDTKRLDLLYIEETEDYTTETGIAHSSAVLLPEGTVVISRDATIGKVGIMNKPMATSQHFINYVCGKELDKHYLYYYLMAQRKRFEKVANGSTIKTIGLKYFEKLKIILPPIEEQRKIARVLLVWDRAIELREKLLEQKRLQKKGLMERLLTGKVRLPGFTDEWQYVKAGEIFGNSSNKKHGGIGEVLSSMQDRGIVPRSQVDIDIKYDADSVSSYKKVETGDFVISLRSFQGGIEYSEYEGLISPAYTVLKNKKDMDVGFYKEVFKSANFIRRLNSVICGIRDGKQIGYDDFSTLKLPYPSQAEQSAIAKVFQAANDEIAVLQKEINHLKLQKKGLMQLLLTGKVRVGLAANLWEGGS